MTIPTCLTRVVVAGLICFLSSYSAAMTVEPSAVSAALSAATLIADIEVLSLEGEAHPRYFRQARATARVLAIREWRDDGGWLPALGDTLTVRTVGGEVNGVGVSVTGYPRPHVGQRYRAALVREEGHDFRLTGWDEGLRPLSPSRSFSRNRTDGSNGSGNGPFLFWDPSYFPVPYFLSLSSFVGREKIATAIDTSFNSWRDSPATRLEFAALGCTTVVRNENDGVNTIVIIREDWAFDPAAIAVTRNFYVAGDSGRAGLILDSDILLNNVHHQFTTTAETGKHDVQNIVTHEVGHFVGLGHEIAPANSDAVMFSTALPGETKKRILKDTDLAGLSAAYGGVGTKIAARSSTQSCSLERLSPTCLAVHGTPAPPLRGWIWIALWVAGAIAVGRFLARSPRRP